MKKEIVIMGDVEIGGGTLTDDFISDKALSRLIFSLSKKSKPLDLVLNGDTFDFLKCPYIDEQGNVTYPRHITAAISLKKLRLMYKAHTSVFEALRRFAQHPDHHVYFIVGNHDHDLFFTEVQEELKRLLDTQQNISFSISYEQHGVYAEHGQQYDFMNRINPKALFLQYRGKEILNVPWISTVMISKFMDLKEEYPFLERIRPQRRVFAQYSNIVRMLNRRSLNYLWSSIFYYPLRYYYDPTYRMPSGMVGEVIRRLQKHHWDIDRIVKVFKKMKHRMLRKNKVYVFGHVHRKYVEARSNWVIIHPDTWRDEYILHPNGNTLTPKVKRYVKIKVHDENLSWNLVACPQKRGKFSFREVINNEKKFIAQAAREEGYKWSKL